MQLPSFLKKNAYKSPPSLLGIDLSDHYIKVAEVAWEKSAYRLINYQASSLAMGQSWADALQDLFEKNNFTSRTACFGLNASSVVTKNIQLDASLTEEELEIEVNERAHHYFNYPNQELLIDFEILARDKEKLELRWIAAKKSELTPKLDALAQLGIHAAIVDIKAYAVAKFARVIAQHCLPVELNLLIHKDSTKLTWVLYDQTNLLFFKELAASELNVAMDEILRATAEVLSNYPGTKLGCLLFSGITAAEQQKIQASIGIEVIDLTMQLNSQSWLEQYSAATIMEALISIGLAMRVDECR